jgi:hypothetical protein
MIAQVARYRSVENRATSIGQVYITLDRIYHKRLYWRKSANGVPDARDHAAAIMCYCSVLIFSTLPIPVRAMHVF